MAKPLTKDGLRKKIVAQAKVVNRLKKSADRARKTLEKVEQPLAFEQNRLTHLRNTPIVGDTLTDEEFAAILAEVGGQTDEDEQGEGTDAPAEAADVEVDERQDDVVFA